MTKSSTHLKLRIDPGPDTDESELEQLTLQLREEIADLDVESVDLTHVETMPEGAKAGDPIIWGNLILALAASGGVLTTLISTLQNWLTRRERYSVTVEIGGDKLQLTGVTSDQQRRIISDWIRSHSKDRAKDG